MPEGHWKSSLLSKAVFNQKLWGVTGSNKKSLYSLHPVGARDILHYHHQNAVQKQKTKIGSTNKNGN